MTFDIISVDIIEDVQKWKMSIIILKLNLSVWLFFLNFRRLQQLIKNNDGIWKSWVFDIVAVLAELYHNCHLNKVFTNFTNVWIIYPDISSMD